jgi:hypothetical protein
MELYTILPVPNERGGNGGTVTAKSGTVLSEVPSFRQSLSRNPVFLGLGFRIEAFRNDEGDFLKILYYSK